MTRRCKSTAAPRPGAWPVRWSCGPRAQVRRERALPGQLWAGALPCADRLAGQNNDIVRRQRLDELHVEPGVVDHLHCRAGIEHMLVQAAVIDVVPRARREELNLLRTR